MFRYHGSTAKPVLGRALFALFSALFGASEWQKGLGPSRLSLEVKQTSGARERDLRNDGCARGAVPLDAVGPACYTVRALLGRR